MYLRQNACDGCTAQKRNMSHVCSETFHMTYFSFYYSFDYLDPFIYYPCNYLDLNLDYFVEHIIDIQKIVCIF